MADDVVPFEDIIAAFFAGLDDEKKKTPPPFTAPYDRDALNTYLTGIYLRRWQRRRPTKGTRIEDCAKVLGRLTVVMYRSELRHDPNDDPIDDVANPTFISTDHIDRAREMYGFYTNKIVESGLRNKPHGPMDEVFEEVDQPCPLCP